VLLLQVEVVQELEQEEVLVIETDSAVA